MATPITCCWVKFLKCEYNLIRSDLEMRIIYPFKSISYSLEKVASQSLPKDEIRIEENDLVELWRELCMVEGQDVEEVEGVLEGWDHSRPVLSLGSVHGAGGGVVAVVFLQSVDLFSMGWN